MECQKVFKHCVSAVFAPLIPPNHPATRLSAAVSHETQIALRPWNIVAEVGRLHPQPAIQIDLNHGCKITGEQGCNWPSGASPCAEQESAEILFRDRAHPYPLYRPSSKRGLPYKRGEKNFLLKSLGSLFAKAGFRRPKPPVA